MASNVLATQLRVLRVIIRATSERYVQIRHRRTRFIQHRINFPNTTRHLQANGLFQVNRVEFVGLQRAPSFVFQIGLHDDNVTCKLRAAVLIGNVGTSTAWLFIAFGPLGMSRIITVFHPWTLLNERRQTTMRHLHAMIAHRLLTLQHSPFTGHRHRRSRQGNNFRRQRHRLRANGAEDLRRRRFTTLHRRPGAGRHPGRDHRQRRSLRVFQRTRRNVRSYTWHIMAPLPNFFRLVSGLSGTQRQRRRRRHRRSNNRGDFASVTIGCTGELRRATPLHRGLTHEQQANAISRELEAVTGTEWVELAIRVRDIKSDLPLPPFSFERI